jgi:hypothetical protein
MVLKRPGSRNWWYKFIWKGELIRESTKQTNKRVAEQIEAAHKTDACFGRALPSAPNPFRQQSGTDKPSQLA